MGGVVFNYRFKMIDDEKGIKLGRKYKSIFDPSQVLIHNVHVPKVRGATEDVSNEVYLNHYFTRSKSEFEIKILKSSLISPDSEKFIWKRRNLAAYAESNSVLDFQIDLARNSNCAC